MKIHLMLSPLVVAVALGGCKKDESERPESAGKAVDQPERTVTDPETSATPDMPEDYNQEQPDGQLEAMKRQWVESTRDTLDVLDKKATEARRELEEAGEASRVEAREQLDNLDEQRRRLGEELEKADERSEEQWDEFKRDIDEASEELEQSYNQLLENLKSD